MADKYEIFEAARTNHVARVKDLLDSGVDVDLQHYDDDSTPFITAASNGNKAVMTLLMERGANINAATSQGVTALHTLVSKKYDNLAIWLVLQGGDLTLKDRKGWTPLDLGLKKLQVQLEEADKLRKEGKSAEPTTPKEARPVSQAVPSPQTSHQEKNIRIYLPNNNYKTLKLTEKHSVQDMVEPIVEVLGYKELGIRYFDIFEVVKGTSRKLPPGENCFDVMRNWPLTINSSKTALDRPASYFMIDIKRGSPQDWAKKWMAQFPKQ